MRRRGRVRAAGERYCESVRTVVATMGRLLAAHWPALIAWFLAGILARYLVIELAGFVGAYTAIGGFLLLPLASLARLISFVAMFLVLRDGMARLSAIAPLPADARERRAAFRDALLSAILPFFAVYATWGFLRDDVTAYMNRALEVQTERIAVVGFTTGADVDTSGTVIQLGFEPWTVAAIVLAFAGRWAWKRWAGRLPRWFSIGAVYLEAVWVFLTIFLISDAFGLITQWVDTRQAMAWIADLRGWLADAVAPVAWAWDGIEWLVGQIGGIVLLPLAWLTIAGVVYGQAVSPQGVAVRAPLVEKVRGRYTSLPQRLRRRLADLGSGLGSRFQPIWRALVLMWRGGPILIGGYILLYTLLLLGERLLTVGITRAVGPHDFYSFWIVADTLILLAVPLVIEPLRAVLVASAYDATIGALIGAPVVSSGHVDHESQEARQLVHDREVETEQARDVVGDQERDGDGVGTGPLGVA
jgi:hypothetical protein